MDPSLGTFQSQFLDELENHLKTVEFFASEKIPENVQAFINKKRQEKGQWAGKHTDEYHRQIEYALQLAEEVKAEEEKMGPTPNNTWENYEERVKMAHLLYTRHSIYYLLALQRMSLLTLRVKRSNTTQKTIG